MSARIVGTGSFWSDYLSYNSSVCPNIACDVEYDYVEVSTAPYIVSDNVCQTTRTIIKKGDTVNVLGLRRSSNSTGTYEFAITANSNGISSSTAMSDKLLYISAVFYKYQ